MRGPTPARWRSLAALALPIAAAHASDPWIEPAAAIVEGGSGALASPAAAEPAATDFRQPDSVARAMRQALEAWLRWDRVPDAAVEHLGEVLEREVIAAATAPDRPQAAADFTAWLGSSGWSVPPFPRDAIDSPAIASVAASLRDAVARWAATPEPSQRDRAAVLAEDQAMLEATLAAADRIAQRHALDEPSADRLRRRLGESADLRRGRRGNPFFPEWMLPRTVGPITLAQQVADAVDRDALLRALGERASIELGMLEADPRTARFRRLLVDAQIDAAAHRIDELAGRTLDETAPDGARGEGDSWRGLAPRAAETRPSDREPPADALDGVAPRTFDSIVEGLLADAPPRGP